MLEGAFMKDLQMKLVTIKITDIIEGDFCFHKNTKWIQMDVFCGVCATMSEIFTDQIVKNIESELYGDESWQEGN